MSAYLQEHTPKYPIYICSKGRYKIRLTSDALVRMKLPHYIIVEEFEYELYKAAVDPNFVTILIMPVSWKQEYVTHDNIPFGEKSTGPGPARNFSWDHSRKAGFKRHWILDDNIKHFMVPHGSKRIKTTSGSNFRMCEDFVDRYTNVPVSGLQYQFFCVITNRTPAFIMNSRIYSALLIENDSPLMPPDLKWSGRYNEDTHLSLCVLKAGLCTIQFNAFLQDKMNTQQMAGGNTDAFYAKEGTTAKSQMLVDLHPDVASMKMRYGRVHHFVDYTPYKVNKLIKVPGLVIPSAPNEYGMEYTQQPRD
jgi:hypothetical protein